MNNSIARVPCTIVTGFLGAGKTTLIRHVLASAKGRRLAALAEGRFAADLDALRRQRQADPALDHDDPIEEVFGDQIACADLVVLNKRDLLDIVAAEKAAETIVRSLPRAVKIVPVTHGKVDPAALLGLGIGAEDDIANRQTRHDAELEHDHDDFESFVVPLPEIADPAS